MFTQFQAYLFHFHVSPGTPTNQSLNWSSFPGFRHLAHNFKQKVDSIWGSVPNATFRCRLYEKYTYISIRFCNVAQFATYFLFYFVFFVMFVFGFAVCSLFYVKFIYVPVCFCYVSQLAPYFPFHVLFYVMLLLFFAFCSLFYVKYMYVSVCVCYVSQFALYFLFYLCFLLCSVLFRSVFLIFCFTFCFLLCFCYFSPVSYCLIFFVCFMLYSFHFSADFLLTTEICNVLVVVSVLCVFLCVLSCFWRKYVMCVVDFCYVWYVGFLSFFYVSILFAVMFLFNMDYVEVWHVVFYVSVGFLFICFVAVPSFLFQGNPSNLPTQLASELGSLELVSQVCRGIFCPSCQHN